MGRTRTQLRQAVVEELKLPFISGTSGTSTTTTLVQAYVLSQFGDNALIGTWIYLTAGSPSIRTLRVTDSVQSTGTLTFIPAIASAPTTATYEVLPFSADAIHLAIDYALNKAYVMGRAVRPVLLRAVTGSPIYNCDFSYWTSSSALHGWALTGGGAFARLQTLGEASSFIGEDSACQLTANASTAYATLTSDYKRFLTDINQSNTSPRLWCWVRTATASNARIAIATGAATPVVTYSSYHTGSGDWEALSVIPSTPLTTTDTDWNIRLVRDANATADFGFVWFSDGSSSELPYPSGLLPDGPDAVFLSPFSADASSGRAVSRPHRLTPVHQWRTQSVHKEALDVEMTWLVWERAVAPNQLVTMEGSGPLTLPTAETSVIEINRFEALIVAKIAALRLLETEMAGSPLAKRRNWGEVATRLEHDIEAMSKGRGDDASASGLGLGW